MELAKEKDRHYVVSLFESDKFAPETPAQALRSRGFTWGIFWPVPIGDSCFFYFVKGPKKVPSWMRPCEAPITLEEPDD